MKLLSNKQLDFVEKALLLVLAGFVFLPNAIPSMSLGALLGISLLRRGWPSLEHSKTFWLTLPAILMLFAWLVHGLAQDGIRELQLWPTWIGAILLFASTPFNTWFRKGFVFWSILQSITVGVVLLVVWPTDAETISQGIRDTIESVFHVHPTFIAAAWFWAIFLLLKEFKPRLYTWAGIALLALMAAICGGKMPLLAMAICLGYWLFSSQLSLTFKSLSAATIIGLLALNIVFNPGLSSRFSELRTFSMQYEPNQHLSSTELRLGIWQCTYDQIKSNWLLGVGTGNTRHALETCFSTYDQSEFFEGEYNTHNQFAHFWLTGGVLSFLLFIIYMLWWFKQAAYTGNRYLLLFLIFFSLLLFTENHFSRQFGMMFWSFMIGSLALSKSTREADE